MVSGYVSVLSAQTVGTTTADLLKINTGAIPAAMGGTYTAMGSDAYSISYNPAGLSYLRASQALVMHLDSLANIQYEYLTFATASNNGALGLNITYRHQPPIDNQNGNPPVTADDLLATLTYAFKLSDSLRVGATAKYIKSDLANYTASAIAGDLGIVLDKLPYGMRVGFSVQNFGTGMKFSTAPSAPSDSLPMFIRFGLGTHQVIDKTKDLNVAVEVFKPVDQDIKMGLGAEFWVFPKLLAVRGGYKLESIGDPTFNVFQNYTLGCSLTRNFEGDDFSLDITYDPASFTATSTSISTSTLEDTFFFALNVKFNELHLL